MTHTERKCFLLVVLMLVASVSMVFAIGGRQPAGTEIEAEPVPISMLRGAVTLDWDEDPVILELNKRLNIDLEFITGAWSEIHQKKNLMLAARDKMDIVQYIGDEQQARDEVILDLTDLINRNDTPILYKVVHSETFRPKKVDGRVYFVCMLNDTGTWALGVRSDWMKKLGLSMPKNEEDFYHLLKAFKEMDPTGTTVGMQIEGAAQIRRTILPILSMFGVSSSYNDFIYNFEIEDDVVTSILDTPEIKAAMKYLNRLYLEGLINSDFPQMSSYPNLNDKYFNAGKSGVGWFLAPPKLELTLRNTFPEAEVDVIPPFAARGYDFKRAQGTINTGYLGIAASSQNPEKALEVVEYLFTKEGRELVNAGIEGEHYKEITPDGFIDRTGCEEKWKELYGDTDLYPLYFHLGMAAFRGHIDWDKYRTYEEAYANRVLWDSMEFRGTKYAFSVSQRDAEEWFGEYNPFQYIRFEDLVDTAAEIDEAIKVGWTRMIAAEGGQFEEEWNSYIDALQSAGIGEWVKAYQGYFDRELK